MATKTTKKKKVEDLPKKECTSCGKNLSILNYYKSDGFMHRASGYMHICKNCVEEMYNEIFARVGSHKIAIYRLCRKLDMPFFHKLYAMAEKGHGLKGMKPYQIYIAKRNSIGKTNGFLGDFDNSDDLEPTSDLTTKDADMMYNKIASEFELTLEIVTFWGANLNLQDYWFLESQYADYFNSYEIDSKTLEELVKQICLTQLIINKKRALGDSVDKDLKTWQELMSSSNLKPNQDNGSGSIDKATFGTLIKRWEQNDPIPEPDPEWKDINKIEKYMKILFSGHLSKMMGVDAGVTEEYLEEMSKYTVTEHGDDYGEV